MKSMRVVTMTLAGMLLAGCSTSQDQGSQIMNKLERGEADMWNVDQGQQLAENQIPPDVLKSFHEQFGTSAQITYAEERSASNNHYIRIFFDKAGTKSSMNYSLVDKK